MYVLNESCFHSGEGPRAAPGQSPGTRTGSDIEDGRRRAFSEHLPRCAFPPRWSSPEGSIRRERLSPGT